jgi:hypothetical protein
MTLSLTQSSVALAANSVCYFAATGGTAPYTYAVVPGGAGGTLNASTGLYTAPVAASSNPDYQYDTITATDAASAVAASQVLVGTPLMLFCQVLQQELGLADGRVYLWDQKIMQPTDAGLFIAVSVPWIKPFANVNRLTADGDADQYASVMANVDVDIISRDASARDRKEQVVLALNSIYAQQQQEANSFYIGKLPTRVINLSEVDGAAIPYRFRFSVQIQYAYQLVKSAPYIDDFSPVEVITEYTKENLPVIYGGGIDPLPDLIYAGGVSSGITDFIYGGGP